MLPGCKQERMGCLLGRQSTDLGRVSLVGLFKGVEDALVSLTSVVIDHFNHASVFHLLLSFFGV